MFINYKFRKIINYSEEININKSQLSSSPIFTFYFLFRIKSLRFWSIRQDRIFNITWMVCKLSMIFRGAWSFIQKGDH